MRFTNVQIWDSVYKYVSYDEQCVVMKVLIIQTEYSLQEKTVFVTLTRRQPFEERMAWVCGVQSDFRSPFPYSGGVKILEVGHGAPLILSAVIDCTL